MDPSSSKWAFYFQLGVLGDPWCDFWRSYPFEVIYALSIFSFAILYSFSKQLALLYILNLMFFLMPDVNPLLCYDRWGKVVLAIWLKAWNNLQCLNIYSIDSVICSRVTSRATVPLNRVVKTSLSIESTQSAVRRALATVLWRASGSTRPFLGARSTRCS